MIKYEEAIEQSIRELNLPEQPNNLYDPLRYFMDLGGKRMRPKLLLIGYNLFQNDWQKVIPQALAMELFHNFTLVHDDIMDHAPTRRGKATVHTKWNRDIAILSGDVLFVKAYDLLTKNNKQFLSESLKIFNATAREVCEGQQMDMDFEQKDDVSIEEYVEMILLKTAVLLGASLKIGALLAGADKDDMENLYQFGTHIGIAFQIHDDYLDVFGNPETFGKKVGGDILNNKKTYLSLRLIDKIGRSKYESLCSIDVESDKIAKFQDAYRQNGIDTETLKFLSEHHNKAMQALKKSKTINSTEALESFASQLLVRQT